MTIDRLSVRELLWALEHASVSTPANATKEVLCNLITQNLDAVVDGIKKWVEMKYPSTGEGPRGYFHVEQLVNSCWQPFCVISGRRVDVKRLCQFWPGEYKVRAIDLIAFSSAKERHLFLG